MSVVEKLNKNKEKIEKAIFNYFSLKKELGFEPNKYDLFKIITDIIGDKDKQILHIIFEWINDNDYLDIVDNQYNYEMDISKKFERKIKLNNINE